MSIKEFFADLVEECLEHMDKGLPVGEAAAEVQMAYNLSDAQADEVLLAANRDWYDRRADIARDQRDLS